MDAKVFLLEMLNNLSIEGFGQFSTYEELEDELETWFGDCNIIKGELEPNKDYVYAYDQPFMESMADIILQDKETEGFIYLVVLE